MSSVTKKSDFSKKKSKANADTRESIGSRISNLITSLGLNQKQFADALGIAASTVSAVIKGTYLPSADILIKTCTKFQVNANFLLLGEGEQYIKKDDSTEEKKKIDPFKLPYIESTDHLLLVMKSSPNFRFAIMAYASQYYKGNLDMLKPAYVEDND